MSAAILVALALAGDHPAQGERVAEACPSAIECSRLEAARVRCEARDDATGCAPFVAEMTRFLRACPCPGIPGCTRPSIYSCLGEPSLGARDVVGGAFERLGASNVPAVRALFASDAFRAALDGEYQEVLEQASCHAERRMQDPTLGDWEEWLPCQRPLLRLRPDLESAGLSRAFDGKPYTSYCAPSSSEVWRRIQVDVVPDTSVERLCGFLLYAGDTASPARYVGSVGPRRIQVCGCEAGAPCFTSDIRGTGQGMPGQRIVLPPSPFLGQARCLRVRFVARPSAGPMCVSEMMPLFGAECS